MVQCLFIEKEMTVKYQVGTFRDAGLQARWTKTRNGVPIIAARDPNGRGVHQRTQWWVVDEHMFNDMKRHGIREAFDNHTMMGEFFQAPA